MTTIPVFFTFDRNYVLAATVAIYSMLKHASNKYQYELYILHTTLTEKDRETIRKSIHKFTHSTLHFIDVSIYDSKIKNLGAKAHYSKEIFYKLIIADLLPQYDRIICSDVDVVFTGDFSSVYFLFPDDDFYYAGVGPIENNRMPLYEKDFNKEEMKVLEHEISAGFLLINSKAIRATHKQETIINFYIENYPRLILPEQDCIVLTCWPHIKYLPIEYSLPLSFYKFDMEKRDFYQGNTEFAGDKTAALTKFYNALKHPIQIHYAGFYKPWNSFFILHWNEWMKIVFEIEGGFALYISNLPKSLRKRASHYSLKRFLRKLYKKVF